MALIRILTCLSLAAINTFAVEITLLSTTDLHGNILPYDYYTAKPAARGLAKIATLIEEARSQNPNSLLLDCGDTIQGSPLETVHQMNVRSAKTTEIDPMMAAMNYLRYDAMAMGNHELNYGLKNMLTARGQAKFPWLSANTRTIEGATVKPFQGWIVKTVSGVKVGIIGITTPAIPIWEKPENYKGYRWIAGPEAVRQALDEMRKTTKPDIVVLIAHAGLDRDMATGQIKTGEAAGENMIYQIATEVPGIDVIFFGHTHQQLAGHKIGNVLLVQAKNWGGSLALVNLTLEGSPGNWNIVNKNSRLIPVTNVTQADPKIMALAKPYHDHAEQYLSAPVAESPVTMRGTHAREMDTVLVDMIHEVQLQSAKADVSFASLFNTGVNFLKGPVTVRELASLYIYDNELYAIEGNGQMVKDALENAARYFLQCPADGCPGQPQTNPKVVGFNYDTAEGVDYEIDLRRPEGDRIVNLKYKGQPLDMNQKLRIAVNNYRSGGSAGYGMFRNAPIVWRSGMEIREMMIDYFRAKKVLPAVPDNNWRLILK